jgi:phosphomannomutase|eukprot:CAMPEP_0174285424 /NCGR_PEP_ID=MMETSP0809-20121228/8741_1 /TAXON_ID=73025 ORGANISM="Eutreptiella gymnastica-like, Strain CCMP1594" /NCGR_SAMPLE_ID=MMETSP0809 /ASSEMBLY_ACC=CAM_ASM_000658 /LENGTH=245 /DNA_ID=CAMNT_0015381209 /DNA_START=24 /DNA_END=761 /DNA_ORIENTATION=+
MPGKTICLFDVDGTLTAPRQEVKQNMLDTLKAVHAKGISLGVVGGSDIAKITEQLGPGLLQYEFLDFVFSENGLLGFADGKEIHRQNIKAQFGEKTYQEFAKSVLKMIADLDIPVMTGTFIEYRNGMVNISPIGRNATQPQRDEFEKYDKEHGIRKKMVDTLREQWGEKLNIQFSVGGQISFDVFPKGWDKTYCLQFVKDYETVHFFGDKTYPGGNDHEIFESERTIGHTVTCPEDTIKLLSELF